MPETPQAQLVDLLREYDDIRSRLHALVDRLDEDTWSRRPASGGWSVAQCVAHLNLTTDAFLPRLREALAAGPHDARGSSPSRYRLDLFGWLLVRMLEPPARFKTKTGAAFEPRAPGARAELVAAFDRGHDAIAQMIRESRDLRLDRLKVISPFDPRQTLRYSVYSALRVIAAHERRHLWQAEQSVVLSSPPR